MRRGLVFNKLSLHLSLCIFNDVFAADFDFGNESFGQKLAFTYGFVSRALIKLLRRKHINQGLEAEWKLKWKL